MTTLAIDCSNYSGEITPAQATELYSLGVRKAIVQLVNPDIMTHTQQIPVLQNAGINVEGYVYIWFSAGETWAADRVTWAGRELARYVGPPVTTLWLDCEQSDHDTPPFDYVHAPTSPTIRACVQAAKDLGFNPGIYTAAWWWIPGVSNSSEFSTLPLWVANYDLDPDLDPVDFGGWTVPRMEQYQANVVLAGVPMLDLNSYIAETKPKSEQIRELLEKAIALL